MPIRNSGERAGVGVGAGDAIFRELLISRSCPARPDVGVQDLVRRGEAEGAPREATEPHPLAS